MASKTENSKPAKARKSTGTRNRKKIDETATPQPTKTTRSKSARPLAPTREEIALRAYYIAEDRQRRGFPGTHQDDWLEAERQLGRQQASA